MSVELVQGDCVAMMKLMPEASIDAIVTDPPYGLGFMGKQWDDLPPGLDFAREALRVLKPGGYLLAFGGTRTYHRLAVAIEDAGFEIRDSVMWLYGSGFPKSHDVSKAIDKAAGIKREAGEPRRFADGTSTRQTAGVGSYRGFEGGGVETQPISDEAKHWQGWGTALKPAHEPIVVARKPLEGTVAKNVLTHGTGAINVDGCRVGTDTARGDRYNGKSPMPNGYGGEVTGTEKPREDAWEVAPGRWPANVVFSHTPLCEQLDEQVWDCTFGCPVATLDVQSGERPGFSGGGPKAGTEKFPGVYGDGMMGGENHYYGDTGGASRFFYCAKTSKAERDAGLDAFVEKASSSMPGRRNADDAAWNTGHDVTDRFVTKRRNNHPTVKPIELMRWLCRLVTPPGGVMLDPFVGSGTTGCAAVLEGFDFIGIEREGSYIEIADARIEWWKQYAGQDVREVLKESKRRAPVKKQAASGQMIIEEVLD